MSRRRAPLYLALLLLLAAAAVAIRLLVGSTGFGWPDQAILSLRAGRAVSAATIGAALATAGVLLQAILRNPLASPWILGLTSGAGLGVVVWVYTGYLLTGQLARYSAPFGPALAGAGLALALVYLMARRQGLIDPPTLILVGVIISVICGALTGLLQHLLPGGGVELYIRWVLGELSTEAGWKLRLGTAAFTLLGIAVAIYQGRVLDAVSLSDEEAVGVGVALGPARTIALVTAASLTAATLMLAGPIGFIGLVAPHAVRLLIGPSHRMLVVGAAIAGGGLLVLADALTSMVPTPAGQIPLGVVTALVGGPVFIILLRNTRFTL